MVSTLQKNIKQKKFFDPRNKKDVERFKEFVKHSKWSEEGCPFFLENPYLSVPHMIQDKMIKNLFKVKYE